jgi:lactate permease
VYHKREYPDTGLGHSKKVANIRLTLLIATHMFPSSAGVGYNKTKGRGASGTAVPMVRVFINSGTNDAGLASMPLELAAISADLAGAAWPQVAPFVGAFLAGSATFSNMMFALLQFSVAERTSAPEQVVPRRPDAGRQCRQHDLGPERDGGGRGRATRQGGSIIRCTLVPMLSYCTTAGALALGGAQAL